MDMFFPEAIEASSTVFFVFLGLTLVAIIGLHYRFRADTSFWVGLWQLLFGRPIQYFRFLIQDVAAIKGLEQEREHRLALAASLFRLVEAFAIILIVLQIVAGLTFSWVAFVPPKSARDAYSHAKEMYTRQKTATDRLQSDVAKLNNTWEKEKKEAYAAYLAQLESTVKNEERQAATADSLFKQFSQRSIAEVVALPSSFRNTREINQMRGNFDKYAQAEVLGISPSAWRAAKNWLNHWVAAETAKATIKSSSLGTYREIYQPNYSRQAADLQNAKQRLSELAARREAAAENVDWKQKALLIGLLGTALAFFVNIWIIGIVYGVAIWLFGFVDGLRRLILRYAHAQKE